MTYTFCLPARMPGIRVRAVIIIIVYLLAFRLAPDAEIPLALGGLAGAWLMARTGEARR